MEMSLEKTALLKPEVRRYKDYRLILRDFYEYKKSLRAGFSFRRFSQMLGLKSPNYMHMVMQGSRNLSNALAVRVAKTLGLEGGDRLYFLGLVKLENAESATERESAQREILVALKKISSVELPQAQREVLR